MYAQSKKYCRDCVHADSVMRPRKCFRDGFRSPVTGYLYGPSASHERSAGTCGPDAKHFEKRKAIDAFTLKALAWLLGVGAVAVAGLAFWG